MAEADRLRLAARVPADYAGYGYAPLLADDMAAVAAIGQDVASGVLSTDAAAAATAADRVQTGLDRIAASESAAAAAAVLPALADRTVGRRINDTDLWTMLRSTTSFVHGATGLLEQVPIDTLGWEFDPVTLAPLGAAFAPARTNRLLHNRNLTNGAWRNNVNATTTQTATGADGAANAASTITAASADAFMAQYGAASTAGVHVTSVYLRRRTGSGDVRISSGQVTSGVGVGPSLLNGTFDAATGWTLGAGWSITGGQLVLTNAAGTGDVATATLNAGFTPGLAYEITYSLVSVTGAGVRPRFEGGTAANLTTRTTPGTFTEVVRPNDTNTSFRIIPQAAGVNAVIDNLTVRPYMPAPIALTSAWQRFVLSADTTAAGRTNPALGIYLAVAGDAIDVDFAQGEAGPFASSVTGPTTTTAVARAEGTISIPIRHLGSRYTYRQGTIIGDWNSQSGGFVSAADTDFFGIISLGDLSANDVMGMLINHAHNAIVFRRTVAGVLQSTASVAITPPTPGQTIRSAFSWDIGAGLMQVAARGAVGAQLSGQTLLPIITHVMPGRFSTTRPLAGCLNGLEIRPVAVFGAALAALT